jgi:anti-anti-sigma regulatory factor/HAMP domain-containing protein
MRRHWLPQNLYLRVLLAMIGSITIVLAILTAFTLSDSQARLKDEMLDRGQNQLKVLIHASSVYFAQQDAHQLILTGQAATEGGQPQFVAFYSPAGELLAAAAAPSAPDTARVAFGELPQLAQASGSNQVRWTDDYLEIAQPVIYYGQPSGIVALRFGAEGLAASFNRELTQSIITALILVVVLNVVVGLLLRQFMIVPLRRLAATSDQISGGVWVTPADQDRSDEFGKLARSFGQMVKTLQAREAQLQEQVSAVKSLNAELDARVAERTHELNQLVGHQEQLLDQIREMSTPVVPVVEGVIVVPIVGSLDSRRATQLIQSVLVGIEEHHARLAVLDITGVPVVDTHVAGVIIQAAGAARLLGSAAVLVGIRPEVAQTLVQLGIDLSGIQTFTTLREALQTSLARPKRVA